MFIFSGDNCAKGFMEALAPGSHISSFCCLQANPAECIMAETTDAKVFQLANSCNDSMLLHGRATMLSQFLAHGADEAQRCSLPVWN